MSKLGKLLVDEVMRGEYFFLGTKAQRHRGTKAQRHKGTEAQRHRGTKAQRHKGTEAQSFIVRG